MLHAFDDVAVAVIHLGELVHDAGHRGAVPRVLGFVIDAGDEAGGMQSQFGADGGPTDTRPEEKRWGLQGAGGGHDRGGVDDDAGALLRLRVGVGRLDPDGRRRSR